MWSTCRAPGCRQMWQIPWWSCSTCCRIRRHGRPLRPAVRAATLPRLSALLPPATAAIRAWPMAVVVWSAAAPVVVGPPPAGDVVAVEDQATETTDDPLWRFAESHASVVELVAHRFTSVYDERPGTGGRGVRLPGLVPWLLCANGRSWCRHTPAPRSCTGIGHLGKLGSPDKSAGDPINDPEGRERHAEGDSCAHQVGPVEQPSQGDRGDTQSPPGTEAPPGEHRQAICVHARSSGRRSSW